MWFGWIWVKREKEEKEKFFRERKSGSLCLSLCDFSGGIDFGQTTILLVYGGCTGVKRSATRLPNAVGCTRSRKMEQSCKLF